MKTLSVPAQRQLLEQAGIGPGETGNERVHIPQESAGRGCPHDFLDIGTLHLRPGGTLQSVDVRNGTA